MMRKNKSSKRIVAVALAIVMIVTSIPFMMISAIGTGLYDPAPYWGDGSNDAAVNTNFVATLNADGSLSVAFPNANPAATWNTYTSSSPTRKSITNYIFTITKLEDDGTRTEIWSENFNVNSADGRVGTFAVDNTAGNKYPNSIYYWPGALPSLETSDVAASYDVSIQAIDSDGWVSDKIHTLLTETPYYIINDDFSPNESWVVREMLLFEQKGNAKVDNANQSDGGSTSPDYSELQGAELIDVNGQMAGMGYNGSAGYRLWIANAYNGTPYVMSTTWSRNHYDFRNAEEVWFYVDLSRAQINKFAFTLSANEKYFEHKKGENNTVDDVEQSQYGGTFATVAVNGVNAGTKGGVYLQNADGLWEEITMTDGYFTNLSGYKGFIRIPIDYFILQRDQYITADNNLAGWSGTSNEGNLENYINSHWLPSGSTLTVPNANGTTRTVSSEYLTASQLSSYGVSFWYDRGDYSVSGANAFKVNPAGTSIRDAHIINYRTERTTNWKQQVFKRSMGTCLSRHATVSVSGTSYTVTNPYYAIQDLVSAGVQIAEWTAESVHKSFYIDQVMFCQKNTGGTFDSDGYVTDASAIKFPQEGATVNSSGTADLGRRMSGFYDRTKEVPKAVAQYIMQYFGAIPSLNDLTAKELVDDIILNYIDCFGVSNSSALSDAEKVSQAIEKLKTLGHTDAYNRYKDAEQFVNYVYSENAESNYNAVIYFENTVESLPKPEFAVHTDIELQETLKQLMAIYETFNLSHYELLGKKTEEKFLELYKLVMGEDVKTGQSIGAYPYIPFNDFEKNYTYGQLSDMYYDDYPAYESSKPTDVNSTGNFTTYVSNKTINQSALIGNAIGWSPADFRPTGETIDASSGTYFSRMDAQITKKGFANSLGATINMGDLNSSSNVKLATLSTTYLGAEADTWGNLPGLDLSALAVKTDSTNGTDAEDATRYGAGVIPNSFVMYVDFTNVTSVNMNIKFILQDSSGNDVNCYFCGGTISDTPVIYLLDENGEWEAQNLSSSALDNSAWFGDENAKALCSIAPSSLNKLEGYKGFIRIPLSNFRVPKPGIARMDYYVFDNLLDDGYKIKQAKITFWDYTGANAGKELTIDGLGFTYDPACTNRVSNNTNCNGELNQDNNLTGDDLIKNMDEYFGVKTVDSSNFERLVSTIDPYASEAEFKASFDKCIDAYLALSDYQKTIPEVKYCYETLLEAKYRDLYRDYTNEIKKDQWKPLYTATTDGAGNVTATAAENLLTALGAVSETAKEYLTDEETLLDLHDEHREDYLKQLGFTSIEEAQSVVDMYELGYHRLSMDDRASISVYDFGRLTNAYNAARRAVLINDIINDVETFKSNIIRIYGLSTHTDDDADRIPDTEDADNELRTVKYAATTTDADGKTVNALGYYTDMYGDISVFGKKLLGDDTDTVAAYMNMYDAAKAIHDNSTAIVPQAGETVPGGIITYENRLKAAYENVAPKIQARAALDTATLNEVEECLGQYEAFLRRYALVDELNYAYAQLALLFPTADLTKADGEQVVLTNSDESPLYSDEANADLTYVAARLNRKVSIYLVTDYKWTQVAGSTYNFGYFTVNGNTGTDGEVVYTKLNDYANGATATFAPVVSVDETAAKKVPTGNVYTGTVKIMAFDSALITDGVDMSTLEPIATVEIPVEFNSINGSDPLSYVVTFDATQEIDWDYTGKTDVSYEVEATLGDDKLTVGVADSNADGNNENDLTSTKTDANGNVYKLRYDAKNFIETEFTGDVPAGTKPTDIPTLTIKQEYWDAVPVGEYKTQLTYTVALGSST